MVLDWSAASRSTGKVYKNHRSAQSPAGGYLRARRQHAHWVLAGGGVTPVTEGAGRAESQPLYVIVSNPNLH